MKAKRESPNQALRRLRAAEDIWARAKPPFRAARQHSIN